MASRWTCLFSGREQGKRKRQCGSMQPKEEDKERSERMAKVAQLHRNRKLEGREAHELETFMEGQGKQSHNPTKDSVRSICKLRDPGSQHVLLAAG